MICKNCETKNDNDALYCENCGKTMTSFTSSKSVLILITTIAILAIIGLIGVVFTVDSSQDSSNSFTIVDNVGNNVESIHASSEIQLNQVPNLAFEILDMGSSFNNITYGSTSLTKNQCIYILAKAIIMIDSGQNTTIPIKSYNDPYNPYGTVSHSEITKDQYIDMAERTVHWMDNNGATPNYVGMTSPGQPDISPNDLLIIFTNILVKYESTGSLPSSVNF